MNRVKKILSVFIAGAFLQAGIIHVAYAATGLTIQPIKVSHTIEPGEEITGYITMTNASSDEEILVELEVQDFIPTPGEFGVNFVERAPGVTTVRDWITLGDEGERQSFRFSRGETRQIPYVINAPPDAEPGGHFGVLFFKALRIQEGAQLKVGTRIGVLVLVTVPGSHLQKGQILGFTAPSFIQKTPVDFKIKFENTGTVHFEPKGEIVITNMFGKKVATIPVQGQIVLPTGIRDLEARWEVSRPILGRYVATIRIVDGEGDELTAEKVSFVAVPIWYTLQFFGLVIVLYAIFRFLKKRVKISINLKGGEGSAAMSGNDSMNYTRPTENNEAQPGTMTHAKSEQRKKPRKFV